MQALKAECDAKCFCGVLIKEEERWIHLKRQKPPERSMEPSGDLPTGAEEVIERFGPMVYRLAFARCRSASAADDIYQEVFLSWLKAKPQFQDAEHAKAWFLRVTANTANSFWRRPEQKNVSFEESFDPEQQEAEGKSVESGADQTILRLDLEHCLSKLAPEDRELIHLFYYEELRSKDIAELLKKTESAVRMRLLRARKALKACLEGGITDE